MDALVCAARMVATLRLERHARSIGSLRAHPRRCAASSVFVKAYSRVKSPFAPPDWALDPEVLHVLIVVPSSIVGTCCDLCIACFCFLERIRKDYDLVPEAQRKETFAKALKPRA